MEKNASIYIQSIKAHQHQLLAYSYRNIHLVNYWEKIVNKLETNKKLTAFEQAKLEINFQIWNKKTED